MTEFDQRKWSVEDLIPAAFYGEHPGVVATRVAMVVEFMDQSGELSIAHIRSSDTTAWTARGMLLQAADDMYLPD